MSDPMILLALSGSGVLAISIAAFTGLKAWQGWLDVKRLELAGNGGQQRSPAMERIEVADLKERIRKLEAIASCVDL